MMKILAMYLPQYHMVPENSKWWGEGFTDWEAVKQAKPLFPGHNEPRVPLGENYYNLLNKETMMWQADLMHTYGIDGMCIYHYWFKKGKRILEKPAENLLRWKDIDMPFCFCWANETWARSWSKLTKKNVWADVFETNVEKDNEILLKQEYGIEDDWRIHFEYLLPFFLDNRYVKIEGKPVLVIYHTKMITCIEPMLDCWRKWASEYGLPGLYIYGANVTSATEYGIDEVLLHEPALHKMILDSRKKKCVEAYTYDEIWKEILAYQSSKKVTYGGFVDYDDSPRRAGKGFRFDGFTPEKFEDYLAALLKKNKKSGNRITFLNAWNEWGEGMYLEPDTQYGYAVLEAVRNAVNPEREQEHNDKIPLYLPDICDHSMSDIFSQEKDSRYLHLMDQWMEYREEGKSIAKWLTNSGFSSVIIYGYGIFGRHLLTELKANKFIVTCIVDKKVTATEEGQIIFTLEDELPISDAMIVTAITSFHDVYRYYKDRFDGLIIPFDQILDEI